MSVAPPLRLAAIEFLNAAPLMWGLEADSRFALQPMLPSACADGLAQGTAELGVIPVIEWARRPELVGLGGLGVAARNCVRSILLISRCPAPRIRSVALDVASRTSAALAQILLGQRFGASLDAVGNANDWQSGLAAADAVLVIGDPALRLSISKAPQLAGFHVYDLAAEWHAWTGLPMVFAIWGIRPEVWRRDGGWLGARLRQARQAGGAARAELVEAWSKRLVLPAAEVDGYLTKNVEHDLGPEHARGLQRFLELASDAGLAPPLGVRTLAEAAA